MSVLVFIVCLFLSIDQVSTRYLFQLQSAVDSILISFWGTDLER